MVNSVNVEVASYPSLKNRVVLITGGASGIGAALVTHFARQGSKVAFLDIDDATAGTLLDSLSDVPHAPYFLHCDLTCLDALDQAISSARTQLGTISVLVNNAANDMRHTIDEVDAKMFERNIAVNLRHQVFATRAVLPDMRDQRRGSIICLGSTGWIQKNGDYPLYAMAKAAVSGFVNGMARPLGKHNIRINTLLPGWCITEKQRRLWLDADGEATIARMQCMPGYLAADDLARMTLFLASDDSRMCSGQDFIVDGGWV